MDVCGSSVLMLINRSFLVYCMEDWKGCLNGFYMNLKVEMNWEMFKGI